VDAAVIVEDEEALAVAEVVIEEGEEVFQEAVVEVSFTFLRARILPTGIDLKSQILPLRSRKVLGARVADRRVRRSR
jgi:hypothetical protein